MSYIDSISTSVIFWLHNNYINITFIFIHSYFDSQLSVVYIYKSQNPNIKEMYKTSTTNLISLLSAVGLKWKSYLIGGLKQCLFQLVRSFINLFNRNNLECQLKKCITYVSLVVWCVCFLQSFVNKLANLAFLLFQLNVI